MEDERAKREHAERVSRLVTTTVDVKADRAMKRQNSYCPQLDEFGDLDDLDGLKRNFARIRRSLDPTKKRAEFKVRIADCPPHRLEKDLMASSVAESSGSNTMGSRHKSSGRRGKRRTTGDGSAEAASAGTGRDNTAEG